ncbi:leucine--tRNA ligase [Membranihabitans maritimus]|uniref:leucine--tRNA ligase n=1 Tax=Membranihabitans maritimus TaxID=2904244 RepID=UPI001F018D70|nr:leucine--tRNA ligase [Membranihabitans maritimus]
MTKLDLNTIEQKWKKYWEDNNTYKVSNESDRPKYYVLDMFPYPSGAGLHVGHPLGYIASDIYARQKRMEGYNVLHPIGFDSFGLPAEQYALQTGIHPSESTQQNMKRYREQLSNLGFSFDWSRQVATSDPKYYKWTQWIFTLLFSHYYDVEARRALPIERLTEHFEKSGSMDNPAFTSTPLPFTSQEWNTWSDKEKSDVLMNYRLAYQKTGYVNWCEELGTVLANDQIKDGVSERGGYPVIKKAMNQWYLRTTAYAERMLQELEDIDWPDPLKTMQRNWIGKSTGATVFFDIAESKEQLEVYTTRPDTIFGVTFMVIAPEHPLVSAITTDTQKDEIRTYIDYVNSRSDVERMAEKKVSGAFTGSYCIHPFTKTKIPIFISEYVLIDYGSGAIMAVPSDDERDQSFAEKFNIPIIDVVDKSNYPGATLDDKVGIIINSEFLNGMEVPEAIKKATQKIEENGLGKMQINYKLRDANFSRQRYWGEPFPIEFDVKGIPYALSKEDLPLTLPDTDNFKPAGDGQSPLARISDWVHPQEGITRETDTMPAVAGSSWYYLRYMDPENDEEFASQDSIEYWKNVDLYVGGAEHAVAHLMYARFWHKFLFDTGYVNTTEPFKKLINQGKIQGIIESIYLKKGSQNPREFYSADLVRPNEENLYARIPVLIDFVSDYGQEGSHLTANGLKEYTNWAPDYKDAQFHTSLGIFQGGEITGEEESQFKFQTVSEQGKMSKSKYNVINPDDIVRQYGADCFRMYEMFLGPIEQDKPWDTKGIEGVFKFIRKLWTLFLDDNEQLDISSEEPSKVELKILHTAIKKVREDSARFSFNTCISAMMVCVNDLKKLNCNKSEILNPLVRLIAPFAPFLSEELWNLLGNQPSVHHQEIPVFDQKYLVDDEIEYPLCINGKKRASATFPADLDKDALEKAARENEEITNWIGDKNIIKVIVVPKRMINFVVK